MNLLKIINLVSEIEHNDITVFGVDGRFELTIEGDKMQAVNLISGLNQGTKWKFLYVPPTKSILIWSDEYLKNVKDASN
jgi:hypothetical protein